MQDYILVPIILITIVAVILLNIYLHGRIVDKAFKKFIIPDLKRNGLVFLKSEPVGLFNYGDFRPKDVDTSIVYIRGDPRKTLFAYVYFQNPNTPEKQRVTVKIDTLFFSIRKVTYSRPLLEIRKIYPDSPYTRIYDV